MTLDVGRGRRSQVAVEALMEELIECVRLSMLCNAQRFYFYFLKSKSKDRKDDRKDQSLFTLTESIKELRQRERPAAARVVASPDGSTPTRRSSLLMHFIITTRRARSPASAAIQLIASII